MKLVKLPGKKNNERWVNPDAVVQIAAYNEKDPWCVIHFRDGNNVSVDATAEEVALLLAEDVIVPGPVKPLHEGDSAQSGVPQHTNVIVG